MSTLSGLASKGEKGKLKYQSLDINNLYRASRGESSEKQQQKSTPTFKHGMQSLGRVPSARRPPANLPSIKSEHSGTDAAVSLVPSGGPGWGKQDSSTPSTSTTPSTTSTTTNCNAANSSPSPAITPLSAHQAAIALPVTTTIPPPTKQQQQQQQQQQHSALPSSATSAVTDKSWSSVMSGNDMIHPPPYQSPQFQHEFPSLSAGGDGGQVGRSSGTDTQYGPGPSLRPQTEGSWMQGGSRANPDGMARSNSAPLGAPPQLSAQVGLVHQPSLPPQYHGILPNFMFRGNAAAANGPGTSTVANVPPPLVMNNSNRNNRSESNNRPPAMQQRPNDSEEMARRPIIKEEDLNRMDDMTKDMGWAAQDEIDYNQKLEFSDDEAAAPDKTQSRMGVAKSMPKESDGGKDRQDRHTADPYHHHHHHHHHQEDTKNWNRNGGSASAGGAFPRGGGPSGRGADEDEILALKRRQQHQVVTTAAERAKQRKEEEEKKYLEAKMKNKQREGVKDHPQEDGGQATISQSAVSPQPIAHAPGVPEWEKDKDAKSSDTSAEEGSRSIKGGRERDVSGSDFRQMAQIEAKNVIRKENQRNAERGGNSGGGYPRQMQNLPPRLQRQQQMRNNSSPQPSTPYGQQYDSRYDKPSHDKDRDRDRYDRPPRPDSRDSRTSRHQRESMREPESRDHHLGSWAAESNSMPYEERSTLKKETKDDHRRPIPTSTTLKEKDLEEKAQTDRDRFERPQRPDSRDSRASRESRHSRESEPREHHLGSWAESIAYEERKKDIKEDRRVVPGPITKEKIEADEKQNEKRNLTQLKKGAIPPAPERKTENSNEMKAHENASNTWGASQNNSNKESGTPWADDLSTSTEATSQQDSEIGDGCKKHSGESTHSGEVKEDTDLKKSEISEKDDKKSSYGPPPTSRHRQDINSSRSQGGWDRNSMTTYRNRYKKPKPTRPTKSGGSKDWPHCGDLEASADDMSSYSSETGKDDRGLRSSQRSPKPHASGRKVEKDDKNREIAKSSGSDRVDATKVDNRGDKMDKAGERKMDRYPDQTSKRDTYEPRGEPSRLGRGGGNVRGRGGSGSISKRIDGYGPPSLKSPFGHTEEKDKKSAFDDVQPNSTDFSSKVKHHQQEQNEESENNDSETVDDSSEKARGGDTDGFQEVKSKKTVKTRQKVGDEKQPPQQPPKQQQQHPQQLQSMGGMKPPESNVVKMDRKPKSMAAQLSQQQIASIPSLMDTPVNPPAVIPPLSNKNTYDRCRNNKLPPRFAKQREQGRLQKVQMHQHGLCDVNDINKVNQNIGLYGLKDNSCSMQINAWNKPIQLRSNMEPETVLAIEIENCKSMEQPPHSPGQNSSSPNATEKMIGKADRGQIQDKSVLDGTTPPVNTIIFENTNYKSGPGVVRNNRNDKARSGNKIDDPASSMENSVMTGFNKPIGDLLGSGKADKSDMQMQLAFNKEDSADMKLDFFESDISHLTEDKTSKNLSLPKSMHAMTSSNSTISPSTADLNFKIASVKKVWDNTMMPPVLEHGIGQEDGNSSFSASFGPDPNAMDASSAFSKGSDAADDGHEAYNASPNQNASNSTTNVCKVKPTQQVPGTTGQNVGVHQQHSGIISSGLMAPLSSPPIQPVIGPNVGLNQAPQQYTTNQHLGYQASLGGSNQYGIPAIPSPPVVYNSTQQLQPQASLYGGFPIDQLGGQRTSQFSQFANPYNLGQTASSPYSAQSLYLPTAQPHAPPTAQAPSDIYQSINSYRIPNTAPYGQNQQLNNPTTVLISSTSNSLMSASVKPSSQPISAIGTKTGSINQTFQQQSQQGQQPLYMTYEPAMQANYLPNTGVMQRGPPGPVQNNVVPALQASSFYSGSTGGQTGYFQQPGNSTLQSGPLQQHQASYGLQGNVFGTHNQSHTSAGLQNLNFLSQMQFAMNVPQYRSPNLQQNTSYLKSINSQQVGDQTGRSQQLKSPGTQQQEVLSSVFNSGPGPQIPSPKSRQNCKQQPSQPSPTTQHKYLYQSVGNQQSSQTQRYPQPIQRPSINFQPNLNSVQSNGSNNHKHRANSNTNKGPTRQYYSPQGGGLSNQNEKVDDSKLVDSGPPNSSNSPNNSNNANIVNKTTAIGSVTNATINNKTEIAKDKDESSIIKD